MLLQHAEEQLLTHVVQLLTLIPVTLRPDINMRGTTLSDLGQDLAQIHVTVHARSHDILELEVGRRRAHGTVCETRQALRTAGGSSGSKERPARGDAHGIFLTNSPNSFSYLPLEPEALGDSTGKIG
jgi:hypothetical protein